MKFLKSSLAAIAAIADNLPDAVVGAGTVTTPRLVRQAVDAGARFLVSPGTTSQLLDAMDHRFLNKEVADFKDRIPTTENLAISIWSRLATKLNLAELHRIRVYETPDLFVDFYGEA